MTATHSCPIITPASSPADQPYVIHPATVLGTVSLTIADLDRSLRFYQDILGMVVHGRDGNTATLGAGGADLLHLVESPDAPHGEKTTGLYHYALLLASRLELGHMLARIAETRTPVHGLVDHRMSEAIYLPDPDGNGIEINFDRPRETWQGHMEEMLRLGNGRLDVDGLLALDAASGVAWTRLHPDTTVGHIHLHVRDVTEASRFYTGVLGFEQTMAMGRSAAFVSAGGYHHHVAFNVWSGATPPPPGAIGLLHFTVLLPDRHEYTAVVGRLRAAGYVLEDTAAGVLTHDPSQNGILLTSAAAN